MPAIVLAAGASRRLGVPKQLVSLLGETLLTHTVRAAREAGADPIFVVLGANTELIVSEVDLSAVQTVPNPDWGRGISTSIRAGIAALLQKIPSARAVMLLVCDQPALAGDHLKSLIDAYSANASEPIVASHYAHVRGIPAIFPSSQFAKLQSLAGDAGAKQILRAPDCAIITIPFKNGEFDIDTPADLVRIERGARD